MPMQSSVGRNCDFKHRHLRLTTGIAGAWSAIPGLRRLQNLFHLDLRLASARGVAAPAGLARFDVSTD
jgi:hypothetical protein